MTRNIIALSVGVVFALSISFIQHEDGFDNFRFHFGFYDLKAEQEAIEDTIKLFNRYFATLFNTGGEMLEVLNVLPSSKMVKRRTVQEIKKWKDEGKVLVYDKDLFELESIELASPKVAVAVAHEVWFLNLQEFDTRKKFRGVKADAIRVRYILEKIQEKWQVEEYEVFGEKDALPALDLQRFEL